MLYRKRLFITGIPTSGKSYLAKKLADATGGIAVLLDDFRESLANVSEEYKKWADFYRNQDEELYYTTNTPDQMWNDLVKQSEGLWSGFIEKINEYEKETRPVIFECVNILPHLANRDLKFPGICLIGESYEETLERNKKDPRWGRTLHLQELEAKEFFYIQRPRYKEEANKYGLPIFENSNEAFKAALKILSV